MWREFLKYRNSDKTIKPQRKKFNLLSYLSYDEFPEDKKRWKWKPIRWVIGLIVFWIIGFVGSKNIGYDIGFIYLILLLLLIFSALTDREGWQGYFGNRAWFIACFFLFLFISLTINYLIKIIVTSFPPFFPETEVRRVVGLVSATPFVLWALKRSIFFVDPIEKSK